MDNLILFALLALVAEILGTIGGFGSSMLFVPLAGFFLDFHSVLGITALYHVMSNLSKIALFREGFDKKLIVNIGVPSVLFVLLGAWISKYFDTKLLEIILAIFLIAVSFLFFIKQNLIIKPTPFNAVAGGAFSGFIAGFVGTGGAIRGLVLNAYSLRPEIFIATSAVIDLAIDLSRSVVYALNGYVHKDDLFLIPLLLVVSLLGTYIGKRILVYITESRFRKIVLLLVFITGIITLIKYLNN